MSRFMWLYAILFAFLHPSVGIIPEFENKVGLVKEFLGAREKPLPEDNLIVSSPNYDKCQYDEGDLSRIIHTLIGGLNFLHMYLADVVVDAGLVARILEVQLDIIRNGHPTLPQSLQLQLIVLQYKSQVLSEGIVDYFINWKLEKETTTAKHYYHRHGQPKEDQRWETGIANKTEKFLKDLKWLANASLWRTPPPKHWQQGHQMNRKINDSLPLLQNVSMTLEDLIQSTMTVPEDLLTDCVDEMFKSCANLNETCVQSFMEKRHTKYAISHQLLFYLVAEKLNCFQDEKFRAQTANQTDPKEFMRTLADGMFTEATAIAKAEPGVYRDLLAEHILLGAMVGYEEFLERDWLEKILSWQHESSGCYLDPFDREKLRRWGPIRAQTLFRQFLKVTVEQKRVKRGEQRVEVDGEICSVHFTSVSIGALAMHLRYLVDTCYP